MSEAERPHRDGHSIAEWITEHHEQVTRCHEEEALDQAAESAAFDLATDISHPVPGHGSTGYDIDTDLGLDKEPPELRS